MIKRQHPSLKFYSDIVQNLCVRSGIRTHARKTGLRPERSALDRSAILTALAAFGQLRFHNLQFCTNYTMYNKSGSSSISQTEVNLAHDYQICRMSKKV